MGTARFSFPAFERHPFLTLVGDATVVVSDVWLTPEQPFTTGAVWFSRPVHVRRGFVTTFEFDMVGTGGKGLSFVMQQDGGFAIGDGDSGGGFSGLRDAVAVEFDTYKDEDRRDPSPNHISIHARYTRTHAHAPRAWALASLHCIVLTPTHPLLTDPARQASCCPPRSNPCSAS